jgi:tetratricopeptide (TPR) repeat protein
LAAALADANEGEQALAVVTDVADQEQFAYAGYIYGSVLARLGSVEQAMAVLERAVAAEPTRSKAWHELAKARFDCGRRESALEAFERALSIDRRLLYLSNYGRALWIEDRLAEAEAVFREALARAPQSAYCAQRLALVLLDTDRSDEALEVARSLPDPEMQIIEALYHFDSDQHSVGLRILRSLSSREGLSADGVAWIARLLLRHQAPEDAMELLRRYIEAIATKDWLDICRVAAVTGHAACLREFLESHDMKEMIRPAYEAIRIIETNDDRALKRLSPELRAPTVELLNGWRSGPADSYPIATKVKRRSGSRTGRRGR